MNKVFIDGREGTTGLRIYDRLVTREDLSLIVLSEDDRKDPNKRKEAINASDITFLCLPDVAAIEAVSFVENENVRIIDASTAHRTSDGWVYGLPELSETSFNALAASKRTAVPGCHAGGFVSLVQPLVSSGILPADALLTCHSITGYSGGGKKMIADYESSPRSALLDAPRQYGLSQQHKHLKEMQAISGLASAPLFSPIVSDFYSGMVVTVPIFASQLRRGASIDDIRAVYSGLYNDSVIKYFEDPGEDGFLSAASLSGKDSCEIYALGNDERIILSARFDNLGKGASGAAVECMNIMLGLDKTIGLEL